MVAPANWKPIIRKGITTVMALNLDRLKKRLEIFDEMNIVDEIMGVKYYDHNVEFKAGDRILACISYKYSQGEFRSLLEKRFQTTIYLSDDQNYALVLCRRK